MEDPDRRADGDGGDGDHHERRGEPGAARRGEGGEARDQGHDVRPALPVAHLAGREAHRILEEEGAADHDAAAEQRDEAELAGERKALRGSHERS
jgi:hypothetical protein